MFYYVFCNSKETVLIGNYSQKQYVSIAFSSLAFFKSNAISNIRGFWRNDLPMKILANLDRL